MRSHSSHVAPGGASRLSDAMQYSTSRNTVQNADVAARLCGEVVNAPCAAGLRVHTCRPRMEAKRQDEADLVRRAKAGDAAAFSEIFERHYGAVYRYIFYRLGDSAAAEDLSSEVFVRLVERIDRYRYRGKPLLAWLYTIARNQVIDYLRRAGRRPTVPLVERDAERLPDGGWDEEKLLTSQMLVGCLEGLTEDQRGVILLKFVEGYNNQMAAKILGKRIGAVKSLQHRGLAALRRCIEREGG